MIEDFIIRELEKHGNRYNIYIYEKLSDIVNYVKSGVYAFQLIYTENGEVFLVKPLDWTKVVSTLDCWSYDGGKTFKYSSHETLIIDLIKLREIKLNYLL